MMHRSFHLLLVLAALQVTLSQARVASAQGPDPTALVRQFAEDVNRGDAAAAAALFSDDANYTGWTTCQSGCKDRAEIVSSIATTKLPLAPETYTVEQVCGDTVVVQNSSFRAIEVFRASGGRLTAHIRDPRLSLSLDEARAVAVDVCAGVKPLSLPAEATSAQDPDNAAVLARFFDRVNHGDSRGAAALFSTSGTYKNTELCSNTCKDRAEIQRALAPDFRPRAPYGVTIEQVCGDTMAALTLPAARVASRPEEREWKVAVFGVSAGQISSYQSAQRPPFWLNLGEARAAAAEACGVRLPETPGPLNKGPSQPIGRGLSLLLTGSILGVIAAAFIALLLHLARLLVRRPKTPA